MSTPLASSICVLGIGNLLWADEGFGVRCVEAFQEVLSLAQLTGKYPARVLLIGCQPQELDDYGGSLRPVVKAAMDEALALGVAEITRWGGQPTRRRTPLQGRESVTLDELALAAYETQRPAPEAACRDGDARFFPTGA